MIRSVLFGYQQLSRRRLLGATAGLVASSSLAVTSRAVAKPRATSGKPNIVFILADDMGYADLSCYGRRDYETPHIDKLAKDGVQLFQGYANSPVCSATRLSLITGRYQYRLHAGLQEPIDARQDLGLPATHPTLPSLLRDLGYRTSLVGKWHMGEAPNFGPLKSGYERFFGIYGGSVDYFDHDEDLYSQETLAHQSGYLTDILTNRAINEIENYAALQQPFFISLHVTAPHWPWEEPEGGAARRPKKLTHLDGGSIRTYAKIVKNLDANVFRVEQALEAAGVADDTIVIFTSDNGGERFSDTWPFVGVKGELLEGGLRVPLIVKWPRKIPALSRSNQVFMSMDFLPTLIAAAGGAPNPEFRSDGMNLLEVLLGKQLPIAREVFWRFKNESQAAVRKDDWKYLKIANKEFLFDLAADEREQANVKEHFPEIFQNLKSAYSAWNVQMLPYDEQSYSVSAKAFLTQRY